jgi:hypothetical protein
MDDVKPASLQGWMPIRVFWRGPEAWIDWGYFGRERLTDPFFRESAMAALRKPFNQAFRRETPISALRQWRQESPGLAPTAFLLHASRCGSTLVSQMLAALETHVVMSEPPMVDAILRANRTNPALDDDTLADWLRGMISALAQPRNGERAFFLKTDSWSILERAVMRKAFPDTPWIYLYRDPLEIAVSQIRERGAYMIPGVPGPGLELFNAESVRMPPAEYITRYLGKLMDAAAKACEDGEAVPMHYSELPAAVWTTFRELLGVADDDRTREIMQQAARWDAKHPQFEFEADAERKQRAASEELRRLNEQWTAPAYARLERVRAARVIASIEKR